MEGRNKFNYGQSKHVLDIKSIEYMISIVNSDITDEDKAFKLYSFCSRNCLFNNRELFNYLHLDEVKKINYLLDIYRDYELRGLFKIFKNAYKCTLEEIFLRVRKINSVYEIINSNVSDYSKAESILLLFKNSKEFKRSYSLFIKYGKNDSKLDGARVALDNFDLLYSKFVEYEESGIVSSVNYINSIDCYIKNYGYARFAVNLYINSSNSYKESSFFSSIGIDKDCFDFCVMTIQELDVDLYNKFLLKKQKNNKIRFVSNIETLADLACGIETGVLSCGIPFSLLEFIKRVPFKRSNFFESTLSDFLKEKCPQYYNIIMNYVYSNRLNCRSAFALVDLNDLFYTKTTINGVEVTNSDKNVIINYLNVNGFPLFYSSYLCARDMFLKGLIDPSIVNEQMKCMKSDSAEKTLIPFRK